MLREIDISQGRKAKAKKEKMVVLSKERKSEEIVEYSKN
jgi:hypothetical protein